MLYQFIVLAVSRFTIFSVAADCGSSTGSGGAVTVQTCDTGLPNVAAGHDQLQQILSVVFAVSAALAVLMIVISGFRLITAQSDAQEVAKARNTIIYALAGLAVALAAEAIVTFVLKKV